MNATLVTCTWILPCPRDLDPLGPLGKPLDWSVQETRQMKEPFSKMGPLRGAGFYGDVDKLKFRCDEMKYS